MQAPSASYSAGDYNVDFFVRTKEGCASDTIRKVITIKQSPTISFTGKDVCLGSPVHFAAENFTAVNSIAEWQWDFGDNSFSAGSSVQHLYSKAEIIMYRWWRRQLIDAHQTLL
jgi:PKD repeat protein